VRAPAPAALVSLVERYGEHPASWVLLEGDKRYVTVPGTEGFVAYERRYGLRVLAGDPVAPPSAHRVLLERARRRSVGRPVFAYSVTERAVPGYRAAGFGLVCVGAEPTLDPARFSLAGGKRATLRAAVNHAMAAGLRVEELVPGAAGANATEAEVRAISREWLNGKGGASLGFLLGDAEPVAGSRKRWFVARSARGAEGFVTCNPVPARGGWYVDVTRRRHDAPRGTIECLTVHAITTFASEGAAVVSLGLSPLARLETGDAIARDSPRLRVQLAAAYDRVKVPYDFRALQRYKAKYAPDRWEPHFLAYTRGAGEYLARLVLAIALMRAGDVRQMPED
jgi:phosphatidylglycerol lysyltransferase